VTIWARFDRHLGADVAAGATLGPEEMTMRYLLLMHYREPADGEISAEAIAEAMEAFGAYGRALEAAGVLVTADVLQPTAATTTVTRREGNLQVQDGPFAETKEALAGVFVLDVPDLDAHASHAQHGARLHRRADRPALLRAGQGDGDAPGTGEETDQGRPHSVPCP